MPFGQKRTSLKLCLISQTGGLPYLPRILLKISFKQSSRKKFLKLIEEGCPDQKGAHAKNVVNKIGV